MLTKFGLAVVATLFAYPFGIEASDCHSGARVVRERVRVERAPVYRERIVREPVRVEREYVEREPIEREYVERIEREPVEVEREYIVREPVRHRFERVERDYVHVDAPRVGVRVERFRGEPRRARGREVHVERFRSRGGY